MARSSKLWICATGSVSAAQDLREFLSLDEAARQAEFPALEAERKLHEEILVFELAAEVEVGAGRPVAERVLPVDRGHDALDVRGA